MLSASTNNWKDRINFTPNAMAVDDNGLVRELWPAVVLGEVVRADRAWSFPSSMTSRSCSSDNRRHPYQRHPIIARSAVNISETGHYIGRRLEDQAQPERRGSEAGYQMLKTIRETSE
jgi:hypothetical protein